MRSKSVKLNFIINMVRVVVNLIFPLVSFPYISRVLLVEGVGKINFATSITNFFLLISSLGIPLYGIREVAKVRDDREKLSKTVSEIFFLNLFAVFFSYLSLAFCIRFFNIFHSEIKLYMLLSLNILFTALGMEWFYQGVEEYTYITLRSIFFKVFSIILMFVFVKEKSDYIIWCGITVFALVGSNILNFLNGRKYFKLKLRNLDFKTHIKPIFIIFSMNIAINIYTNLDSSMLGILGSIRSVGIYTAAIKLNKIVMTIAISLGTVIIPRLSYYLGQNNFEEYYKLANKSINFIVFFTLPSIIGLYILAPEIIDVFSGESFAQAVITMRILLPIIPIIAFTHFIGIQILYPNNKEKLVMYSVIVGAVVNFTLNYFLIPVFYENGAAIATLIGESSVLIVQIILGRKYLKFKFLSKSNQKFVLSSIVMAVFLSLSKIFLPLNSFLEIVKQVALGGSIYVITLLILRENNLLEGINKIKYKFGVDR
ncbi:flippase [uncultured Ilyobacter sp.]|uniref:flippase n=1 Tax=uncultured Ilyobacter sp. TaxID=544433 RepID=UPI0029F5AB10|nr:flippase [uncultured Ilyobacter sp.]